MDDVSDDESNKDFLVLHGGCADGIDELQEFLEIHGWVEKHFR